MDRDFRFYKSPTNMVLRLGKLGLDFDTDYGLDKRTGWTAILDGRVLAPELTTLPRALRALVKAYRSS